jgi:hypothetical protein
VIRRAPNIHPGIDQSLIHWITFIQLHSPKLSSPEYVLEHSGQRSHRTFRKTAKQIRKICLHRDAQTRAWRNLDHGCATLGVKWIDGGR